jgi:hypothetical protein
MLTRDDILERLLEPYESLTEAELSAAKELSRSDAEVADALKECRAFARLEEPSIFGVSARSDAEFVVALRERIQASVLPVQGRGLFVNFRVLSVAVTSCVVLMAVILGSNYMRPASTSGSSQAITEFASALDPNVSSLSADSIADAGVDPDSLADYLGVADLATAVSEDDSSDDPAVDQLLALDQSSLEEVLNSLENTNFF